MKVKSVKQILAISFLLSLCLSAACQATPEQEVVVKRDNTEQAVMESAMNNENVMTVPYEVPEHVEKRFTVVEGVMDIAIDADVELPDVDRFPVASVKSTPITQARADEFREYFMKEGQLFTYKVQTKADYDTMIVEARRGHEVDGEYVFDEDSQRWVDELIEMRKNAPDEDVSTQITDYSIDGDGLSGQIVIDGKEAGNLSIRKDSVFMGTKKMFWDDSRTYYTGEDQKLEMQPCDINMTEEEATETAQKILSDLGIDGMAVKEMHKAYFLDQDKRLEDEVDYGGYSMIFMRTFGGLMPVEIQGYGMGPNDQFDVSPPVDMEVLHLAINDRGEIEQFSWRDPAEITGTLTEHVDILPFEDIMARLEEFTKLQFAYMGEYESDVLWLKKVNKIGLNLNYLPIKNNPTEFMLAPCWYFTYIDSMEYTDEQIEELKQRGYDPTAMDDQMGEEYFVFSAVDGASVSVYSAEQFDEMMRWEEEMKQEEEARGE